MYGNPTEDSTFAGMKAAEDPEKYVRESFTWRRMTNVQVWTFTAVSAALILAAIAWEMV